MKEFLLLVGLVGAAIYAFLIFSHHALTDGKSENTRTGQAQPIVPSAVPSAHLSSWDAYLPTRSQKQSPELATAQPIPYPPQQSDDFGQSERGRLAASESQATSYGSNAAEPEPVERTRVVLAAEMHSQASVSAPTLRYYRPGTELQVVRREGIWFLVSDPVTQARGWVLEQYLSSIAASSPTQVATESTTESLTTNPALPKSKRPKSKRTRSAKPAVRVSHRVVVANADPWGSRWSRHAYRRPAFRLFMFHPFARFAAGR